jgi:hypothetical protein
MMESQSPLSYYFNKAASPNRAEVKNFGSVVSLLGTILPPGSLKESASTEKPEEAFLPHPIQEEDDNSETISFSDLDENIDPIEKLKEFAENALLTTADKHDIEKVNEEIERDLKNAFLNESITLQEAASNNYYKLYRDRDETFECKVNVEGAALSNSSARLILESDVWNLVFSGKIYKDGRCIIPLRKMTVLPEGTIGKARLEIIIDDTIFVPWEDAFMVEGLKKVSVEILSKNKVSVNLKDDE